VFCLRVIVRDNDDVGAGEDLRKLRAPSACPAGIGGRENADLPQPINIAFALDDENRLAEPERLSDFGQAVGNLADAFDGPKPFAGLIGVGAALAEILRIVAAD
jgi:hypothetical protein